MSARAPLSGDIAQLAGHLLDLADVDIGSPLSRSIEGKHSKLLLDVYASARRVLIRVCPIPAELSHEFRSLQASPWFAVVVGCAGLVGRRGSQ